MGRPSLLAHLVPLIRQPEPAATRALRYVLESGPEEVASAFVERLAGGRFEIGRIGSEWQFEGVQPDLVIYDARGEIRLFVENKFWAPLTDNQPVEYLKALRRADARSVLAFIVPEDRAFSLWAELKDRCERASLDLADETRAKDIRQARVAERTLVLASWRCVLGSLRKTAIAGGHTTVEQDVAQLRGLTEQMNADVFSPLRGNEATDTRVARRMLNYGSLIDSIRDQLCKDGVADTKGLKRSGWGRSLRVHGRFVLYLCVSLKAWRDSGITPLWCQMHDGWSGIEVALGDIDTGFNGTRTDSKGDLRVPIRLLSGVEHDRVIHDAVRQMRNLADRLLEVSHTTG